MFDKRKVALTGAIAGVAGTIAGVALSFCMMARQPAPAESHQKTVMAANVFSKFDLRIESHLRADRPFMETMLPLILSQADKQGLSPTENVSVTGTISDSEDRSRRFTMGFRPETMDARSGSPVRQVYIFELPEGCTNAQGEQAMEQFLRNQDNAGGPLPTLPVASL